MDYLQQNYSQQNYSQYTCGNIVPGYEIDLNQVDQGNQIIQETPLTSMMMNDYFHQQYDSTEQYDSAEHYDSVEYNIVNLSQGFLSPPLDQPSYEHYDLKPNMVLEHHIAHLAASNVYDDQEPCGNIIEEIERPDLKVVIPEMTLPNANVNDNDIDVKPFIPKSQSLPSPPTSPNEQKRITSTDVEDESTESIKQEEKDDEDGETKQNDLPVYVNPKQYRRILKRRIARERFEKKYNISKVRKPYIHESRHNHAIRRPRGPGGRFLNSSDITEVEGNKRKSSLNSTTSSSSSCLSPTTPSSTYFSDPSFHYNNDHLQTPVDEYLFETCKNNDYFNAYNLSNLSNAYEEYTLQTQTPTTIYVSSTICPNEFY